MRRRNDAVFRGVSEGTRLRSNRPKGPQGGAREVLELRLQRELRERIDLLRHVDVVGVRHVVPVRHPRDDSETPLQALRKAVGRGLERRSVERVVDVLGGLPLRRVLVELPHDLKAELLPFRLGELPAGERVDAFPQPRVAERDRRVAAVQKRVDALPALQPRQRAPRVVIRNS